MSTLIERFSQQVESLRQFTVTPKRRVAFEEAVRHEPGLGRDRLELSPATICLLGVASPTPPGATPTPGAAATPRSAAQPSAQPAARPAAIVFPGVRAGQGYEIDGRYQGHSFGGKARLNAFDGRNLDLNLNVSAAMGFYKTSVHLSVAQQADGNFKVDVVRDGKQNEAIHASAKLVRLESGLLEVETADGKRVKLSSGPNGALKVNYLGNEVDLKPVA